jgi:hypothetical protein
MKNDTNINCRIQELNFSLTEQSMMYRDSLRNRRSRKQKPVAPWQNFMWMKLTLDVFSALEVSLVSMKYLDFTHGHHPKSLVQGKAKPQESSLLSMPFESRQENAGSL